MTPQEQKQLSQYLNQLTKAKVNQEIKNGWEPIGGHQVSEQHRQNRYSGTQHMDTIIKQEYSQSMIKKN